MTKERFFELLASMIASRTVNPWETEHRGSLRLEAHGPQSSLRVSWQYSPITAVCRLVTGKHYRLSKWHLAAEALSLHPGFALTLARAGQNNWPRLRTAQERRYRRQLCKILSLHL